MMLRLYRADPMKPPFRPVCSWSDSYDAATARRAQLVVKHGFGTIWEADVAVVADELLDVRADPKAPWTRLGESVNARLRDAVHERAAALADQGLRWVVFAEPDQPGAEYVYLAGPPISAVRADPDGSAAP